MALDGRRTKPPPDASLVFLHEPAYLRTDRPASMALIYLEERSLRWYVGAQRSGRRQPAGEEAEMAKKTNPKQTSPDVASQAGRDLRNKKTPARDRAPIASDLAQAKPKPTKGTKKK